MPHSRYLHRVSGVRGRAVAIPRPVLVSAETPDELGGEARRARSATADALKPCAGSMVEARVQ